MSTHVPMGTIVAFVLKDIPDRWLLCDGSAIPADDYEELIQALGSPTTPNLNGRTLVGTGVPDNGTQSDGTTPNFDPGNIFPLGYFAGEYKHALTTEEMPSHAHTLQYQFSLASDCHSGSGSMPCQDSSQTNWTNPTGGDPNNSNDTVLHNTMQPYFTVNYIIYGGKASAD